MIDRIRDLLAGDAQDLLEYRCTGFSNDVLPMPSESEAHSRIAPSGLTIPAAVEIPLIA